jgi:hypothetical protein
MPVFRVELNASRKLLATDVSASVASGDDGPFSGFAPARNTTMREPNADETNHGT